MKKSKDIEIILLQDVEGLGSKHDFIKVKRGYARNFLIPKKLAVLANKENRAKVENIKRQEQARLEKMREQWQAFADTLANTVITIPAKVGESGKIFGTITTLQIAQKVREVLNTDDIDRRMIEIDEDIKTVGTYEARLKFSPEVVAPLHIEVVEEK